MAFCDFNELNNEERDEDGGEEFGFEYVGVRVASAFVHVNALEDVLN